MRIVDYIAAERLADLREQRGLSREALAADIRRVAVEQGSFRVHGAVDAFTIRRIERDGHCPSERVRLVIARYFELNPKDIWDRSNRHRIDGPA